MRRRKRYRTRAPAVRSRSRRRSDERSSWADRRNPVEPWERKHGPKPDPERAPGEKYGKDAYNWAIRKACVKAGVGASVTLVDLVGLYQLTSDNDDLQDVHVHVFRARLAREGALPLPDVGRLHGGWRWTLHILKDRGIASSGRRLARPSWPETL